MVVGQNAPVQGEKKETQRVESFSPSSRLSYGKIVIKNAPQPEPVQTSGPSRLIEDSKYHGVVKSKVEGEPVVVMNGKSKKISKHSAYLLDMLTIDEE